MKPSLRTALLLLALLSGSVLYPIGACAEEPPDNGGAKAPASDNPPTVRGDSAMSKSDPLENSHFVLIYRHGPAYVDSLPAAKQPGIEQHFRHVESYVSELPGFMILGGPFLDDSGALMIFLVPSEREVRQFAESDPIVRSGLVEYSIHPWTVAVRSDSQ